MQLWVWAYQLKDGFILVVADINIRYKAHKMDDLLTVDGEICGSKTICCWRQGQEQLVSAQVRIAAISVKTKATKIGLKFLPLPVGRKIQKGYNWIKVKKTVFCNVFL